MTRGRENPACSITETGKRAEFSQDVAFAPQFKDSPRDPEAPTGKREAEEDWRRRLTRNYMEGALASP